METSAKEETKEYGSGNEDGDEKKDTCDTQGSR